YSFLLRCSVFRYRGCRTRSVTDTTAVLSIDADVTTPSRVLRGFERVSAIAGLQGFGGGDLPSAQFGVDARDVVLQLAQLGVVVELTGDVLEAEAKQRLLRLRQPFDETLVGEVTDLGGLRVRHQSASSRVMKRALIGSFWMARSSADRAVAASG